MGKMLRTRGQPRPFVQHAAKFCASPEPVYPYSGDRRIERASTSTISALCEAPSSDLRVRAPSPLKKNNRGDRGQTARSGPFFSSGKGSSLRITHFRAYPNGSAQRLNAQTRPRGVSANRRQTVGLAGAGNLGIPGARSAITCGHLAGAPALRRVQEANDLELTLEKHVELLGIFVSTRLNRGQQRLDHRVVRRQRIVMIRQVGLVRRQRIVVIRQVGLVRRQGAICGTVTLFPRD